MVNHPRRSRGLYTAKIGGSRFSLGPEAKFVSIREACAWAEEYGDTADYCLIYDPTGREVARHLRDTSGNGQRWFRAHAP